MEYTSFYSGNFKNRLTEARRKIGMTQSELANSAGITQTSIAAYEQGRIKPRQKILNKIAYILKVTPDWLANGGVDNSKINNWDDITPITELKQIPLYNDYEEILTNPFNADREKHLTDLHPTMFQSSYELFALKIKGESMEINNNLGFPDGSIVTFKYLINSEDNFINGSFCLINIDNIITFKQVFRDELKTRLHPLNPDYPDSVYNNDEYKILAKAIYVEINLDDRT